MLPDSAYFLVFIFVLVPLLAIGIVGGIIWSIGRGALAGIRGLSELWDRLRFRWTTHWEWRKEMRLRKREGR